MGLSEKAVDYLEDYIPELAEVAFKQALLGSPSIWQERAYE